MTNENRQATNKQSLDLREVYQKGLAQLDMGPEALQILERVAAGDDRGMDIEEAVKSDQFFTTQIITQASSSLKRGDVQSLAHAAVLLGHEMVRDFVLGHSVLRSFDKAADSRFESFSKSRDYLVRTRQAQQVATKLGDEHLGLALAAGFVFDVFERRILSVPTLAQHFEKIAIETWSHACRTAAIAFTLSNHPKIEVKYKRLILATAILHDVGKLFLAVTYPERYQPLLKKMEEIMRDEADEYSQLRVESDEFGFSHSEFGSLLLCQFQFLEEIESAIEFHHDFSILKTRDPDMYILTMILHLADRLALLTSTKANFEIADIKKILDPFRQSFPLFADEVSSLMVALRSKGLLS